MNSILSYSAELGKVFHYEDSQSNIISYPTNFKALTGEYPDFEYNLHHIHISSLLQYHDPKTHVIDLQIDTKDILFICGGAFVDLEKTISERYVYQFLLGRFVFFFLKRMLGNYLYFWPDDKILLLVLVLLSVPTWELVV